MIAAIKARVGLDVEVLPGDEEAPAYLPRSTPSACRRRHAGIDTVGKSQFTFGNARGGRALSERVPRYGNVRSIAWCAG